MFGLRQNVQKAVVQGFAAGCRLLDEIPSVGREYAAIVPDEANPADEPIISAAGFTVFRHGGWGSRFTLLPQLSAELDQRWHTQVWQVQAEEVEPEPLPSVAAPPPTGDTAPVRRTARRRRRTSRRTPRSPSPTPV